MPKLLPDGTCRWEGFLFDDGIVNTIEQTPDLLQGMSLYNDILHGSSSTYNSTSQEPTPPSDDTEMSDYERQ